MRARLTVIICFSISSLFNATILFAEQARDLYSMSLEELLSTKVSVASVKETSLRESPGIITVIYADEIKKSGARDLVDVLRAVPGFEFGVDVQGQIGVGIRGNWANEGKVSLRLDGVELNETLYSTIQILNRLSIDNIKQIEIIRGPGSSIYGGFAELAVINIKTKDAKELDGLYASAMYGQMQNDYAHKNVNLMYGKALSKDLDLTSMLFAGKSNTSDGEFEDVNGAKNKLAGYNTQTPFNLVTKVTYKELKTDLFVEQYRTTQRDEFGTDLGEAVSTDFYSYFINLALDHKLSSSLTLTPSINYKKLNPWKEPYTTGSSIYVKTAERYTGNVSLSYDMTENANIITGIEYFEDRATDETNGSTWYNGDKTLSYTNFAGFLQGLFNTPAVNITLGARYNNHSKFKPSFTPRIGLTKIIDKLHFKLLYSKAYRAPSIENINLNNDIEPENTTVTEFETGYVFNNNMLCNINIFSTQIDKPIVYAADPATGLESYYNFDKAATNGAEVEYKIKNQWGYVNASYSFYRNVENTVDKYQVPGNSSLFLAFPAGKAALSASYKKNLPFSINPSVVYLGERYGYIGDGAGGSILKQFDGTALANIYFLFENIRGKNLDIGLGFYDIFKSNYVYIQPYNGDHPPLPQYSSEAAIKVSYKY